MWVYRYWTLRRVRIMPVRSFGKSESISLSSEVPHCARALCFPCSRAFHFHILSVEPACSEITRFPLLPLSLPSSVLGSIQALLSKGTPYATRSARTRAGRRRQEGNDAPVFGRVFG